MEVYKVKMSTITAGQLMKIEQVFPAVTVTVVRDGKIQTVLRTNQTAGFFTLPS